MRGHKRWRGQSIEVRVHVARGVTLTRTVRWQGSAKATDRAADRALTALLADVDADRHATGPDATFRTLAEAWWRHRRPNWSPSTAAAYRSRLDHRILPHLGDLPLRKVTPARLAAWLDEHAGTAPASRAKAWQIVRAVLEHGRRLRWITHNPAADLDAPSVPPSPIAAPAPADVQRALAELARHPDAHTFVLLAADTGARRGELCGLRWSDLDEGVLTIRRSVVWGEDRRMHVRPFTKGRRPRRVTLDARTVAALAAHRVRCAERALACGVPFADGFVFAAEPDGRDPADPLWITQLWGRMRDRAGLDGIRLHDLRHFVATRLLDAGFAAADVAARLGHANPSITQRIYAHAIPARDAEMAATMGRLLG